MTHASVVISGAGPNGLMLACELALAGITPVVLDALPGPSDEPKANGLVGQVVRLLDMRGLYARITGLADPPRPAEGWISWRAPRIAARCRRRPSNARTWDGA